MARLVKSVVLALVLGFGGPIGLADPYGEAGAAESHSRGEGGVLDEAAAKVIPVNGYRSRIVLGDSVLKLVQHGVIDRAKFDELYRQQSGLPSELRDLLEKGSKEPILLTRQNANYYVNVLWPLGLANHMAANEKSPINGRSLFGFASTGGWNLGKEANGGAYFSKVKIVHLTPAQEARVMRVASNTYRPCCNNSTFFQDCNHGSALLGLLQLGAAQGLSEEDLYREALAFNSFWFPSYYIQAALYFKAVRHMEWAEVDARTVIGRDFSSASGWLANVDKEIKRLGLIPQNADGAQCAA